MSSNVLGVLKRFTLPFLRLENPFTRFISTHENVCWFVALLFVGFSFAFEGFRKQTDLGVR